MDSLREREMKRLVGIFLAFSVAPLLLGCKKDGDKAATYPISCDHIPRRSWALLQAREVMLGVLESFRQEQNT